MKIYLAGGVNLTTLRGWIDPSITREREVRNMFPVWKRVFSFYYMNQIRKSEILKIVKDENKQD